MFLRNRKIKAQKLPYLPLHGATQLSPEILESLTQKLRDRTITQEEKQAIFKHFIGMAISIASKYASKHPEFKEDFCSEAFIAIANCLKIAPESLTNNQITPWISTSIHGKLSVYANNNKVVGLKYAGIRWRTRQGKEIKIPQISSLSQDEENQDTYEYRLFDPVDPRQYNLSEVEELIDKAIMNPLQRKIIELRRLGFNDVEIAEQLHTSKVTIGVQRNLVKQRFYSLYKEF